MFQATNTSWAHHCMNIVLTDCVAFVQARLADHNVCFHLLMQLGIGNIAAHAIVFYDMCQSICLSKVCQCNKPPIFGSQFEVPKDVVFRARDFWVMRRP